MLFDEEWMRTVIKTKKKFLWKFSKKRKISDSIYNIFIPSFSLRILVITQKYCQFFRASFGQIWIIGKFITSLYFSDSSQKSNNFCVILRHFHLPNNPETIGNFPVRKTAFRNEEKRKISKEKSKNSNTFHKKKKTEENQN